MHTHLKKSTVKDRQHRIAADLQYSRLSLTYVLHFMYKDVYYIGLDSHLTYLSFHINVDGIIGMAVV